MHLDEEECLEELLTLKVETSLTSLANTRPPTVSITQKQSIMPLKTLTKMKHQDEWNSVLKFNPLQLSVFYIYHLLLHTKTLNWAHRVYVLYGSHNKQRMCP